MRSIMNKPAALAAFAFVAIGFAHAQVNSSPPAANSDAGSSRTVPGGDTPRSGMGTPGSEQQPPQAGSTQSNPGAGSGTGSGAGRDSQAAPGSMNSGNAGQGADTMNNENTGTSGVRRPARDDRG